MKAIHGGKAKHDQSAAHQIAVFLRGGRWPQASVYPAEMRATRDRFRRRCHRAHKRAELVAHLQNTNRQYHLPEIGQKLASKANREGGEDHCPEPSGRKTIAVEVSLIAHDDQLRGAVELSMTRSAKPHEVQPCARLPSVPGIGQRLALVIV